MPAITLCFDTCYHWISAGIFSGTEPLAVCTEQAQRNSSTRLIAEIQKLFTKSGTDKPDRILCTTGPGSFTGVRITVATGRNLAQLWKIPCAGIPGLSFLLEDIYTKFNISEDDNPAVMIDGKQSKYYCQSGGQNPVDSDPAEFMNQNKPGLIFTDNPQFIETLCSKDQDQDQVQIQPVPLPEPVSMLRIAEKTRMKFHDYSELIPVYLREDPATAKYPDGFKHI